MSCWCHSHRPGDCTALGHHRFGERLTCVAPERSLDWSEVVRPSLGYMRLLTVENSAYTVTEPPQHPSHSLGLLVSISPHRSPASTLAVSQGPLDPLPFHFVTLSGILLSLPVRGHRGPPPTRQEARGRSKGKSTRAKYGAGKFPASRLQFKASPQKRWLGLLSSIGARLKLFSPF